LVFRFGQGIVEHLFGEGDCERLRARAVIGVRGVVSRIVLYLIGLSVVRTVARPPAGGIGACCPVS